MSIEPAVGQELEWRQPEAMRRLFQLSDGRREVASLRFESSFGSLATGECAGNRWTFKRTGFLSPKITVRAEGSDLDLAVFTPGWAGNGWVAFHSGPRYQFHSTNFWRTEWTFTAADGSIVLTLSGRDRLFKQGGLASVTETAAGLPETPVLLLLSWYVRVLMHQDASAGAVVAAVG